jgi:hypothetical protein
VSVAARRDQLGMQRAEVAEVGRHDSPLLRPAERDDLWIGQRLPFVAFLDRDRIVPAGAEFGRDEWREHLVEQLQRLSAERDLEILGRLSLVAVVVADGRDGLPNVEPGSLEPRAAAGGAVHEPNQRVLVGSEPFLDVALSERAQRDAATTRSGAEPVERCVGQAQTEWLSHVALCSALHYAQRGTDPPRMGTAGLEPATSRV